MTDQKDPREMSSSELWNAARNFDIANYAVQEAVFKLPPDLAGRSASSFSPAEMDRALGALGADRQSRLAVDAEQLRWERDETAVQRRADDIERVRLLRAGSVSGGGS